MASSFLFTSESVCEGHPDKVCDQVSDAVLDACLEQDPDSRVACEASAKTGYLMVFGELTTKAKINVPAIVRNVIKRIGYDYGDRPGAANSYPGLDYKSCAVLVALEEQSPEISEAVTHGHHANSVSNGNGHVEEETGAGDQGLMFGYATDETEELMPITCVFAHAITKRMAECRRKGIIPWLRPDGKSQVTVEYKYDTHIDGESAQPGSGALIPQRVHTIVISAQTDPGVTLDEIRQTLIEKIVKVAIPGKFLDEKTIYHMQPSGSFIVGGPQGDAGLTGRKIIVDTYGGWGAHGGGCFSGKDYTKVDRSASYAARWIAKSLVASKLCRRCLIQLSYSIGIAEPLSINVNTYGTSTHSSSFLLNVINKNFKLTPGTIVKQLHLKKPIYLDTATYGHFKPGFAWEVPKKLEF